MSITNAERHDLHKALEEILGEQRANVMMEHLPPVGWAPPFLGSFETSADACTQRSWSTLIARRRRSM